MLASYVTKIYHLSWYTNVSLIHTITYWDNAQVPPRTIPKISTRHLNFTGFILPPQTHSLCILCSFCADMASCMNQAEACQNIRAAALINRNCPCVIDKVERENPYFKSWFFSSSIYPFFIHGGSKSMPFLKFLLDSER